MDAFVAEHQDRSRNALQKSMEAAFGAFVEELRADQAQFQSELLSPLGLKSFFFGHKVKEPSKIDLSKIMQHRFYAPCIGVILRSHHPLESAFEDRKGECKSTIKVGSPTRGPQWSSISHNRLILLRC